MRTDKEKDAISELKKGLKIHKLVGWNAKLTGRGKKYTARTKHGEKVIELSTKWLAHETTTKTVYMNTILHEIAHALTPGDGHGQLWKSTFTRLGGSGRMHSANKVARTCYGCGKVTNSAKRLRVCPKCKAPF